MKESKIISQEKNPFLSREEIIIEISSEATPTIDEIKKEIGKEEKLIVIKKINTNFGKKKFIAELVVYDTIEAKNKVETIPKKIRAKMAEEEKTRIEAEKKTAKEEKATAEAEKATEDESKKETPTEEKVEETKPEPSKDDSGESKTE